MTRLALCLLLLATGASAEQMTLNIEVIHDDKTFRHLLDL